MEPVEVRLAVAGILGSGLAGGDASCYSSTRANNLLRRTGAIAPLLRLTPTPAGR